MQMEIEDETSRKAKDGYYFTKRKLIIAAIVVVVVIIIVGVSAGLTGRALASHGETQSTEKPTDKMTEEPTMGPTVGRPTTGRPQLNQQQKKPMPTAPAPTPFTGSKAVMNNIRLPGNVEPVHYEFSLDIDVLGKKFNGTNVAEFKLVKSTDIILIHRKMMELTKEPLLSTDESFAADKLITLKEVGYYSKYEYQYMMVDTPLALGTYYLKLEFKADLTESLFGIYLSQYRQYDGKEVWMVGSQCEPAEARRIMPLFDEPTLKATFDAKSVKMSTYLLAFVISEYAAIEEKTNRGTTMRIWAPKDRVHYGAWALRAGIMMTEYFECLFNQTYPLSKQDMVSISDFNFGAMENWGLIIYVERALLFNENEDTDGFKEIIARIVCHELAHMWFGNLVTFHWWNNVWINEGFATFYEYFGTAAFMPTWEMMNVFLVREVQPGLRSDASKLSHPMEVHHFPSNNMILDYFSAVAYNKGGSVLRMLRNMLGNDKFDAAIRLYVQQNKWKEAYPHSLWSALQESTKSSYNITAIGSTWIRQMGHPIITVARDPSNPNKGIFTQQRYLSNNTLDPNSEHPASPHKSPYGYKWNIPINWFFGSNKSANYFQVINMKDVQTSFDWPAGQWIKANTHQFGFFRVNYPEENWLALANGLQKNLMALDTRDISNLIDDSMTFAE
ncbi:uncharacterized protein TRIADDRAFT_63839 [Trichoplax adhaerens]|uniref:glutamyl aminopeptidase n=1 Tax=Trichoplax adhaerens TaxID=10228 RepID=B3RUZ0_TRIAD|nr:hypothetical protein TRIADDRAFT_63839 [Trichoplax adhaerens]EDV25910.1 hypothetical protein TRIADDRAFT_63839 [Trichoplax adhaerens]|eukprot:XP_002111943.1 hypothetical protein TRIADDRAFT_63839 [Trichoplax adhaerens]